MNQPIARLRCLRSVELRTPAFIESADFYAEVWGLRVVEQGSGRAPGCAAPASSTTSCN